MTEPDGSPDEEYEPEIFCATGKDSGLVHMWEDRGARQLWLEAQPDQDRYELWEE